MSYSLPHAIRHKAKSILIEHLRRINDGTLRMRRTMGMRSIRNDGHDKDHAHCRVHVGISAVTAQLAHGIIRGYPLPRAAASQDVTRKRYVGEIRAQ